MTATPPLPGPARGAAPRHRAPRHRGAVAVLTVLALLLAGLWTAAGARAATDYTQSAATVAPGSVLFAFTPATPAALVDVHYRPAADGQQNVRMTAGASRWETTATGLAAGTVLEYWFTYEKAGPLYDTPHFTVTVGAGGSTGGGGTGSFPLTFVNNTRGAFSDAQVYVTVLGMVTPGQWSYLRPDGTTAHIDHRAAQAPGHLTKNGVDYPNMSFTLDRAATVPSPAAIRGGRVYISLGSPLYIPVSPDDQGWGGPDPRNPADPNNDVYYDWYEYTYVHGEVPFGGNTTQVDGFGFPMTARLRQAASGYDSTEGITRTRAEVMAGYAAAVGPAFRALQGTYRITAPRSSAQFQAGGAQQGYLQPAIDRFWSAFSARQFTLTRLGETFTGRVTGDTLTFTKNGAGPFHLAKPASPDVMACAGPLAAGDDTEKQLGAELCAAFQRGVALTPDDWYRPAAYYRGADAANDYAGYLHGISLGGRSYAFPYDDINDQSSVQILGNAAPPTGLTLGIGW
ncbi:glycoside hydrolase family 64 protein [Kitasatospora sp. NPDC059973]|uniref:glycoside hydrolase family 64 protein n=1 Tax=Kitasatospora sp. NPDC059973 TaxID=3347020 RepID=UPI0036C214B9